MRARRNRFTKSTLKLLVEKIHTIWNQSKDKIVTLLSMNVVEIFSTMSHKRLLHNMRKRKISQWIIAWIASFLDDRKSTLAMNNHHIESFRVQTNISQKSSISFILYLFYNANLLNICERANVKVNELKFVNDVNLLIYDKSIVKNCTTIKNLHKKFETWARRHECIFAFVKYQLIHLTKNFKKFDMTISINIVNNEINSIFVIKMLDFHIDTALKWDFHVKKIQKKMTKQTMTLTKLSISIWKATLKRVRRIYTAMIRSAMTYEFTVWHTFEEIKKSRISSKLATIQNKCFRSIADAYKATSIAILEWSLSRNWDNFFDSIQLIETQSHWVNIELNSTDWVEISTREWRISRLVWSD